MSTKNNNNNNNNDSNKTKKGQAAAAAVDRIDEAIAQQQRKRHEMETLIGHTVQFVAARMESENQIGTRENKKRERWWLLCLMWCRLGVLVVTRVT